MRIGIVSPFNPFSLKDYYCEQDSSLVSDWKVPASAVHSLVRGLIEAGHDVYIYTSVVGQCDCEYKGERVVFHNVKRDKLRNIFFIHLFLSKRIERDISNLDILHAHWTYEFACACLPFVDKLPVFCTIRDWFPYLLTVNKDESLLDRIRTFAKRRMFEKVMSSKNIHFVANSQYTLSKMNGRASGNSIPVIPNSIPTDFVITKEVRKEKSLVFISVAQNLDEKRKNIISLIDAYAIVSKKYPDARLYLVGYYSQEGEVYTHIKSKCLTGIKLLGNLSFQELKSLYDESSILVHPALEETFGNILLEAMSRKIPVIAGKDAGAVPFVLEDGKYGVLCDVASSQEIATSMVELFENEKRYTSLSETSYKYVCENYLNSVIAYKHITMYNEKLLVGIQ